MTFADSDEERNALGGKDCQSAWCKTIENILLVEDNEVNREIMHSQLTSLGYQVDTAVNGKEALLLFQNKTYDVVLTDMEMPEMDGYELVAEIHKLEKNAKDPTPVFAITASDFDLNDERAKSLGFAGYMLKPLDLDLLRRKLARIGYMGKLLS
jgi:CheY-like chemotaxis protein